MNNFYHAFSELVRFTQLGEFTTFLNHNESQQYRKNSTRLNLENKDFNEFSITENDWNVDIFIHRRCLVSVMDKNINRENLGKLSLNDIIIQREFANGIENLINDNKLFNYYYPFHRSDLNNLQYSIGNETFVEYNDEYLVVSIRTNQYWYCNFFLVYDKTLNCKVYVVSYYSNHLSSNYSLLNFQGFFESDYKLSISLFDNKGYGYYYYYYYYYYQILMNDLELSKKNDNFNEITVGKGKYKKSKNKITSHFKTFEPSVQETDLNSYTYYNIFNEGNPNKSFDVYNDTIKQKVGTFKGIKDVLLDNKYNYKVNGKIIRQDMKLGHITGNISVQECFDENDEPIKTKFKIRVERTDRTHIGDYDVINGFYEIPQLDVNSRYNIFLIDEYGNMEWQVLSNKQPRPLSREQEKDQTPISHKVIWSNNVNGYFIRVNRNTSIKDKVFYRNNNIGSSHTIVGKHSLIINGFIINHIEMNNDGQKLKSSELSVENVVPTDLRMV